MLKNIYELALHLKKKQHKKFKNPKLFSEKIKSQNLSKKAKDQNWAKKQKKERSVWHLKIQTKQTPPNPTPIFSLPPLPKQTPPNLT